MGQVTANIGIYIPAAGETNYDASFAAGMINIDQHDHSGGPNKGVPITSSGIADDSITFEKLNANVADNTTGIGTAGAAGPNQLSILGILKNLYQLATATGFLAKNGSAVTARTFQGTANQIAITNPAGVAGDPTFSLSPVVIRSTQPSFLATAAAQNAVTGDGTVYTVTFGAANAFNFDQAANFANPIFTCPNTGVYLFDIDLSLGGIVVANTTAAIILQVNGASNFVGFNANLGAIQNAGNGGSLSTTQLLKLTAGDTVRVQLQVSNNGAKNINVLDGTFSGALLY